MPAKNGVPADVPPVGTIGPSFHDQVRVVDSGRGEGNVRNVARIVIRHPGPVCHAGRAKTLLIPPPLEFRKVPGAVSFQPTSGM